MNTNADRLVKLWERPTCMKTAQEIHDDLVVSKILGVSYRHSFEKLPHSVEGLNMAMKTLGIKAGPYSIEDPVTRYWFP